MVEMPTLRRAEVIPQQVKRHANAEHAAGEPEGGREGICGFKDAPSASKNNEKTIMLMIYDPRSVATSL